MANHIKYKTFQEAVMAKTIRDTNNCWLWIGMIDKDGYGIASWRHQNKKAHRMSYLDFYGEIDSKLVIDHLCRVRSCVNPTHLELVTTRENALRGYSPVGINHKKTHCSKGHEYTDDNLWIGKSRGNPERMCKTCCSLRHKNSRVKILARRKEKRKIDAQRQSI